ncbi:flavin reductase family protein [Peribacillus asahii]|uniref:Flavin reductase family protein n=1 Tax=Peribacillus asahii TaxID=228899 RepID=A0A398AX07_9BACI|nr:flavin reductase family protein [Peribacillus asahii]RID82187.1 flavin reductase family protein [Peribacillus asahii]
MISITPESMSQRENYKFLTGSIIPRPIAFVTTQSDEGVVNAAPFSYFNIVSANPPLISVSVQRKNGAMKDTARNALKLKEFVVHIVDEDIVADVNETAAELPANESELSRTNFTLVKSERIAVPAVKEAKIRFECKLEEAIQLGGQSGEVGCDLLIGKIVCYHIEPSLYQAGRINAEALKPVARLAGNNYSKLGQTFEIKRPTSL